MAKKRTQRTIKQNASRKTKPRRSPQKRRALTEEKILKAAVWVFSRKGYDGSTTKEISRKAGANEALIIRYFGSKQGLFLEIIRRFVAQKRSGELPYPPQKNLEDELACEARNILEDMEKNLDLYKILLGRSTIDTKMRKKISDIIPREGDPRVLARLEKLRQNSRLPADIPTELLLLIPFQALSAMFLATTALHLEPKSFAESLEVLVRATVRGLQDR
jgi:AcrR family transcriptional regulator